MNVNNILHKLSYLKWLFFMAEIVLILYCLIVMPEDLISYIGIIIFITGIHLGLDSLSDVEHMSTSEKNRFRNGNYASALSKFILIGIVVLILISMLFFSLKFIGSTRNAALFDEFFNLGLNLWALILGLLCLLKSVNDKQQYVGGLVEDFIREEEE